MSQQPQPPQQPKPDEGIVRSPSGRNRARAKSLHDTLGGSPLAIKPKPETTAFHLVVCGATSWDKDGSIFSDFLAYCTFLGQKKVRGTFLSCFPVEKHFAHLRNSGIRDIKFGLLKNGEHILRYTDVQMATRESRFWEDVQSTALKKRVFEWIKTTATQAKAGDLVQIILEGHGNKHGAIKLGENFAHPFEFAQAFDTFTQGVQINAINTACYSGLFVDTIKARNPHDRYIASSCLFNEKSSGVPRSFSNRCRGSRYEQAWVQSFAKLDVYRNPLVEDKAPKTIKEYENYILENIYRNFSTPLKPPGVTSTPQYWVSSDNQLAIGIEDMVVRDKIDILYSPEISHRRRRIEWPTLNPDMHRIVNRKPEASDNIKAEAMQLLDYHASKCEPMVNFICDMAIFDLWPSGESTLKYKIETISNILQALYWRGRLQSTILDVFIMLLDRGFVCLESIQKPMQLAENAPTSLAVFTLLSTFEAVIQENSYQDSNRPYGLWEDEFIEYPLNWLAAVIVRGSGDIEQLFDTIRASKFLGEVDMNALESFKKSEFARPIICNPEEIAMPALGASQFGLFLPHGVGEDSSKIPIRIAESIQEFNRIERVFKKFFNIPDSELLTEEAQATYMDENPGAYDGAFGKYIQMKTAYRKASGKLIV